ncbi:hypothetical protein C7212DRAFT_318647 [Tuber magnatum]|uniref:Uncharacterized protein n=1 Tax=Tuber magnatum TaxID=42249 RepID=A0A317SRG0_9PEZI|nr:hypothetical protein C7212DRAFT_318647 [Tuber magnatum]
MYQLIVEKGGGGGSARPSGINKAQWSQTAEHMLAHHLIHVRASHRKNSKIGVKENKCQGDWFRPLAFSPFSTIREHDMIHQYPAAACHERDYARATSERGGSAAFYYYYNRYHYCLFIKDIRARMPCCVSGALEREAGLGGFRGWCGVWGSSRDPAFDTPLWGRRFGSSIRSLNFEIRYHIILSGCFERDVGNVPWAWRWMGGGKLLDRAQKREECDWRLLY